VDIKISVCTLSLALSTLIGVGIPMLVAADYLPARFVALGNVGLTLSIALYFRSKMHRYGDDRELAAYRLGQSSRGDARNLRSLVD
jgi:hypothetical protein